MIMSHESEHEMNSSYIVVGQDSLKESGFSEELELILLLCRVEERLAHFLVENCNRIVDLYIEVVQNLVQLVAA